MAELCEFEANGELVSSYYRLCGIMAERGGENMSYECGLTETQNDAGAQLSNNPELPSTDQQCVVCSTQLSRFINYIGSLQELCQARAWDLPKYEYKQGIKGLTKNQKNFYTVKCSAGPFVSEGVGKNKKMAKKQAAKMLLKHWVNVL
ncbi:interferon-inducible double-stranded RNA-dependent protein kinase activator A-like [Aphis gossypii]|uniref:interferon-inducible double-stranded RNA-dependent protein kinase activator A-like n=1 Tax=Aphis gossypii TaxID=80765 RepID=UPI0021596F56|nr:interferon-inducible double-stranded RNA-dependent protein kinase activator A-like [Aphis gossypii]XP_050053923.1 interferon-inducible double-stranded RNA-dependent protein kinase activator A-like [Aphis gossypii]